MKYDHLVANVTPCFRDTLHVRLREALSDTPVVRSFTAPARRERAHWFSGSPDPSRHEVATSLSTMLAFLRLLRATLLGLSPVSSVPSSWTRFRELRGCSPPSRWLWIEPASPGPFCSTRRGQDHEVQLRGDMDRLSENPECLIRGTFDRPPHRGRSRFAVTLAPPRNLAPLIAGGSD